MTKQERAVRDALKHARKFGLLQRWRGLPRPAAWVGPAFRYAPAEVKAALAAVVYALAYRHYGDGDAGSFWGSQPVDRGIEFYDADRRIAQYGPKYSGDGALMILPEYAEENESVALTEAARFALRRPWWQRWRR